MKKIRILAVLMMVCLLFGGSVVSADSSDEPVDIVLWAFADTHARYFEYISEQYNAEHPNVNVTVEVMDGTSLRDRLKVCIAAGGEGAPDLADIEQGTFPSFMNEDSMCFYPLEELLERDGLQDAMVKSRLDLYAYKGHYYGLEHALCPVTMAYRPDLFEQYGIEIPTTWDEYKAAAHTFKDNGIYITSQGDLRTGITAMISMFAIASGNDIVDENGEFQFTDGYIEIIEEYKQLVDDGCVFVAETDDDKYFEISENRVATEFAADWAAGWLRDNVPEQSGLWAVAPLPKFYDDSARVSVNGGTGLCMLEYVPDEKRETVWDFMKYAMLDPENCVTKYNMVSLYPPVYAAMEACNTPVEYYGGQNLGELWQELAPETPSQYQAAFRAQYTEVVNTYLYDYVEGNMPIEEFAEAVKADMEQYIQ